MKTVLRLSDFFAWVNDFNYKRGWDLISASMALVHLSEELGELADVIVNYRKETLTEVKFRNEIAGESADAMILLIKLAQVCDVDLLTVLNHKGISEFVSEPSQTQDAVFAGTVESYAIQILQSLGELARHVNFKEKFKNPEKRTGTQRSLVDELALMFELFMEVLVLCQIDVPDMLRMKMDKIAKRFDPETAQAETQSYLQHSASASKNSFTKFQERFRP